MTKSEKLKHCQGCEQNFYNGNNPYDIGECWSLGRMKLIWRKRVHIDQRPPWKQKAKQYPNCYQVKRYVFIEASREY